ncbi:MAG: GNAT family N-acetyltransferase [Rhodocyclaceae bacterium]|nr:GNAT family N-acetyltransferase [Rhodocyclaceae bacterium]
MMDDSPLTARMEEAAFSLKEFGPEQAGQVLALFHRAFAETPPRGWYEWKYGAEGLQGRAFGLYDAHGHLLAHYAGFPRRLFWQGEVVEAMQIGDVMTAPEARASLTRHGPFYHVCTAFFAHWVGHGKPFRLAFGFPHARAIRLGMRLGLYREIGAMSRFVWPAARIRLAWPWQAEVLDTFDDALADFTLRAWAQMTREQTQSILGQRDAAFLLSRYAKRPAVEHRYLLVRRAWPPRQGLAVFRVIDGRLRWLDYIGPRAALAPTVTALRSAAWQLNLPEVETWCGGLAKAALLPTSPLDAGPVAHIALAKASTCPAEAFAKAGWWLAGDTDFL